MLRDLYSGSGGTLNPTTRWLPTQDYIARKMLQMAGTGAGDVVYDLGCGDARILIMAVKEFGVARAIGYEIREELCQLSQRNIAHEKLQHKISIIKGDLFEADLSDASVIALYLSNEVIEFLRPKLEREAKLGTRVVSRGFSINGWRTTQEEHLPVPDIKIYLYMIPEAFR